MHAFIFHNLRSQNITGAYIIALQSIKAQSNISGIVVDTCDNLSNLDESGGI